MLRLEQSLHAWQSDAFKATLKDELERAGADSLPLQKCLTTADIALSKPISVRCQNATEMNGHIRAKVGVFFEGATPEDNCVDDPTPLLSQAEYCEFMLDIDKVSAETRVELIGM